MRNAYAAVIVFVVLAIVGGAIVAMTMGGSTQALPTNAPITQKVPVPSESTETVPAIQNSEAGVYVPFTTDILEASIQTRRVLFFYANWCPTCSSADKNITENIAKLPPGTTLIRVNYNDTQTEQAEKDLAKKYDITYQHSFVVLDESGNAVTKWNGGEMDELIRRLK